MTPAKTGSAVKITKELKADSGADTLVGPADGVEHDDSTIEVQDTGDAASANEAEAFDAQHSATTVPTKRRITWSGVLLYGVWPALVLLLVVTAGWMNWQESRISVPENRMAETIQAASEATTAMLSYKANSVEQDLHAAQGRLTGSFKDSYTRLTNDVVIPGAKAKQISAVARISAAGSVSVTPEHAVVLLFVNQTVTIGKDAPSDTASVVRVSMHRVDHHWLVSAFEPI